MAAGQGMSSPAAAHLHTSSMSRVEEGGDGAQLSSLAGETAEATGCAALAGVTKMSSLSCS